MMIITDRASLAHAEQTGVLLVAMDGVRPVCGHHRRPLLTVTHRPPHGPPLDHIAEHCPACFPELGGDQAAPDRPPALLVEAAKPCETCGGSGTVTTFDDGGWAHQDYSPCPDCHNGKRRITVQVPCKRCEGRRTIQTYDGDLGHLTQPCPDCQMDPTKYEWSGATGQVTVGTVVHKWGPIEVADGTSWDAEVEDQQAVLVFPEPYQGARVHVRLAWGEYDQIDPLFPPHVDPATWVGKYVSAFEILS